MFATSIRRLAPYLRVLHCPAGDLKRPMSSPSLQSRPPASPGYSTEIEMLLKDREVSKRLDVSLSQAFRYTITGGLDVDTMNLAVGSSTEDPICMLTIASSMHCRSYQKFPGVRGGVAGTFAWLRSASPCLAALKGQCMALYADSDTASLALTRDALVRAGFVGVCGLSHTCFIANSLEET